MGRLRKKRKSTFSLFFLKYFFYLFLSIVVIAILEVSIFSVLLMKGAICSADYAQKQTEEAEITMLQETHITKEMIPKLCQYAIFDKTGKYLDGDIGKEEAWRVVSNNIQGKNGNYYKVISGKEEICVLQYQLRAQYSSAKLRQVLPSPEMLFICNFLVAICFSLLWIAFLFGKNLKKQLQPLNAATHFIQTQELDFKIGESQIKEINLVLKSMDEMRISLKESLLQQWNMEQQKKEQIAALAHDLKTPLTIVRGNAEFLNELQLLEEQKDCVSAIMESSVQMQNYISQLIEMIKSKEVSYVKKQEIDIVLLLNRIKEQCQSLCTTKQIWLDWNCSYKQQKLSLDEMLVTRAVLNVCSNAVDFTSAGGRIRFSSYIQGENVKIEIEDSGSGFSKEALKHATEEFYMGDKSRHENNHYGMGLFVVKQIVSLHGGELILENSETTLGGKVSIVLPLH